MKINKSYLFFVSILMIGSITNGCIESAERIDNSSSESINTSNIKKSTNEFEEKWREQYRNDHAEADLLDKKKKRIFGAMNLDLEQLLGFFEDGKRGVMDYYVSVSEVKDRCRRCSEHIATMKNKTLGQDEVLEKIFKSYKKLKLELEEIEKRIDSYREKKDDLDKDKKDLDEKIEKLLIKNDKELVLRGVDIIDKNVDKSIKVFGFIENLPSEKDLEPNIGVDHADVINAKQIARAKIVAHMQEVLYSSRYADADLSSEMRKDSMFDRRREVINNLIPLLAEKGGIYSEIALLDFNKNSIALNDKLILNRKNLEEEIEKRDIEEQAEKSPDLGKIAVHNLEIERLSALVAANLTEIDTLKNSKDDLDSRRINVTNRISAEESNDPLSYNNLKASYTKNATNEYFKSRESLVKQGLDEAMRGCPESMNGITEHDLVKSRLVSFRKGREQGATMFEKEASFLHLGEAHALNIQEYLLDRAEKSLHREQELLDKSLKDFDKQLKSSKNSIEVAKDISNFMAQVSQVIDNNEKLIKDPAKIAEIDKFRQNIVNSQKVLEELNNVRSMIVPGNSNRLKAMEVEISCQVQKDADGNILNIGFVDDESIKIYEDLGKKNSIAFKKRPYKMISDGANIEVLPNIIFGSESTNRSIKTEMNNATGMVSLKI